MYPPLLVDYQQYFQEYTTNTKRVRRIKKKPTDFLNCCHTQTIHELKSNLNAKYFNISHQHTIERTKNIENIGKKDENSLESALLRSTMRNQMKMVSFVCQK